MIVTSLVYTAVFIATVVVFVWAVRRIIDRRSKWPPESQYFVHTERRSSGRRPYPLDLEYYIQTERRSPLKLDPLDLPIEKFGRAELEGLRADERAARLSELGRVLESKIPDEMRRYDGYFLDNKMREFYKEITPWLIQGLKDIGHDIWYWDLRRDEQIWGGDYMRRSTAGKLVVTFIFPATVLVGWEDISI